MKKFLSLVLLCGLPLLAPGQGPSPAPMPVPDPHWEVRVELLMVDLPQAQALALLPTLHDEAKTEEAYARILAAIERKEAKLIDYPVLRTRNGVQASAEAVEEFIYPVSAQPPQQPQNAGTGETSQVKEKTTLPTGALLIENYEKRNTGTTLQVEPSVRPGGKWIDLCLSANHVAFQDYDRFEALKPEAVSIAQPQFFTTKIGTEFPVRNGQRTLCGFHKLKGTEDRIELDILQVVATWVNE